MCHIKQTINSIHKKMTIFFNQKTNPILFKTFLIFNQWNKNYLSKLITFICTKLVLFRTILTFTFVCFVCSARAICSTCVWKKNVFQLCYWKIIINYLVVVMQTASEPNFLAGLITSNRNYLRGVNENLWLLIKMTIF